MHKQNLVTDLTVCESGGPGLSPVVTHSVACHMRATQKNLNL